MPLPETMTERRLHERVQRHLDREPGTSKVTIEVHGAVVTLGGIVKQAAAKNRAAEVALETAGIASVHNRIYVDEASARTESLSVAARDTLAPD